MKEIKLTKGQVALVDDADFVKLSKFKWHASKNKYTFYATRNVPLGEKQRIIAMHRVIMNTPKGLVVDHIDGNGLNNQRNNLRVCTISQNNQNRTKKKLTTTSCFKGVSWSKTNKKWTAQIGHNGKQVYLGSFSKQELAYKAYIKACKKYHGQFAKI